MDRTLSHINEKNQPSMVDVGHKKDTRRTARAQAVIRLPKPLWEELENGELHTKKGPVFQTAIVAGTMALKKTHELVPFCHPLAIEGSQIDIEPGQDGEVTVFCEVSLFGKTGVEMEALTGANVAALTIYDMCKSMGHEMEISSVKLLEKKGGKSDFKV